MTRSNQEPAESLVFVLTRAARLMRDRYEAALKSEDLGLTPGEAKTLSIADRLQGAMQADIAAELGIQPMSLVNYLDKLEARGLIMRVSAVHDRRVRLVHLTELAKPQLRRVRGLFDKTRASAMSNFTEVEIATLHNLLSRLCADMSEE
jgi:MarR family transcriptional regulator, transcriptional regulator for hemolysin